MFICFYLNHTRTTTLATSLIVGSVRRVSGTGPGEAAQLRDRDAQVGGREVVEEDDVGAGLEHRSDLVEAVDLHIDEQVGADFARAAHLLRDAFAGCRAARRVNCRLYHYDDADETGSIKLRSSSCTNTKSNTNRIITFFYNTN